MRIGSLIRIKFNRSSYYYNNYIWDTLPSIAKHKFKENSTFLYMGEFKEKSLQRGYHMVIYENGIGYIHESIIKNNCFELLRR